jgi:hypothetical protein
MDLMGMQEEELNRKPGKETTMIAKRPAVEHTAYTDLDRQNRKRTEEAILAEYDRLHLPPVRCAGVLLSPALVKILTEDELEEHPEESSHGAGGKP